ncbi:MAG: hypothetical protein M1360_03445 [Candidatus Marsarchaeota archaeon]|jgi:hypothetical protein|nr:hypothetical protein [Candidatus Marsarchaeota archaeon]MCL5418968.1 hypothetical protein [Candidatus Marsarchaeota archaeon]
MGRLEKQVIVYIDSDLYAWLSEKAANGYKKASLIRHILQRQMEFEKNSAARRGEAVQ